MIKELNPSKVIGLSTNGKPNSFEKLGGELKRNSCLVIGGFQKGHFSDSIENNFDELYSIGDTSFEGHVVVSRMLYEYEKTIFM